MAQITSMAYADKVRLTLVGRFEINLKGQVVTYSLKRSSRAKLIWLHIKRDIGLTVTVPLRYNTRDLNAFLEAKSAWINKHLERIRSSAAENAQALPLQLDSVCYLGKPLAAASREIRDAVSACGVASLPGLVAWLKSQAERLINLKAQQFSQAMGLKYNSVRIRDQKSRWGSCSCRKNLSLNWRLIMAPEAALDYVIIHELCHLKEMSHSKAFWSLVAQYCPDWRVQRRWLNQNCSELNLIRC